MNIDLLCNVLIHVQSSEISSLAGEGIVCVTYISILSRCIGSSCHVRVSRLS